MRGAGVLLPRHGRRVTAQRRAATAQVRRLRTAGAARTGRRQREDVHVAVLGRRQVGELKEERGGLVSLCESSI